VNAKRSTRNVVWANVQITVVREADGAMRHLVLVAEDITASRSAEQALQAPGLLCPRNPASRSG